MLAMKYREAKDRTAGKPKIVPVTLTKHSARMLNTSKVDKQGNIFRKTEAIVYYNSSMGGVDRMDQQLHGIQVPRKTYRWYKKTFFENYINNSLEHSMTEKGEVPPVGVEPNTSHLPDECPNC